MQKITLLLFLIVYSLAFFIQHHVLLNGDMSLLMHTTDRLLHGGKYGINFFETTPPMILYVLTIPVISAKLFATNFVIASFFFIFSLSLFCLILTDYYIKDLECLTFYKRIILLPASAIILLIPPGLDFGQREHLMLMLIFPFLFATAVRINKINIPKPLAIFTGFLAGIGFCIKPQFFLCFILVELFYLKTNKKIRLETLAILFITIIYIFSVILYQQSYFTLVLPHILNYYYQGLILRYPIQDLLTYPPFCFSFFSCFMGYLFARQFKDFILEKILTLAILCFCIIYLIQQTPWFYHIIPAFSLSLLLVIQIFYRYRQTISEANIFVFQHFFAMFLWAMIFYFPLKMIYQNIFYSFYANKSKILTLYAHTMHFPKDSQIYFFIDGANPTIDYLSFKNLQFMQNDWYTSGIIANNHSLKPEILVKDPLIKQYIKDFLTKNPDIIVLDNNYRPRTHFQTLSVFSEDKCFKARFQEYVKIIQFNHMDVYAKKNLAMLDEFYDPIHIASP